MSLLVLCAVTAATAAAALWLEAPAQGLRKALARRVKARAPLLGPRFESGRAGGVGPLHAQEPGSGGWDDREDTPLLLELIGSMLQAGLPLSRALEVVAPTAGASARPLARVAAALRLGVGWDGAWPSADHGTVLGELRDSLHFAAGTGAPSAELLFARARQLRRIRHRELERRAAALGVRLVVPLGVCSLPAFLCLGVVPVLLAMLPGG